MPRMNILTKEEQDNFDSPSSIKELKQKKLLDFPDYILEQAKQLREIHNRIYFLLVFLSFKNSKKLFAPNKFLAEDISFIAQLLKIELAQADLTKCRRASIARYHKMVLSHYGNRGFNKESEIQLIGFIEGLISKQVKPKLIFWEAVDWLVANRIVVPSYFQLSEIILKSLKGHKKRLIEIVQMEMTCEVKLLIDNLFEQQGESSSAPYKITLLRKFSQSTKPTQVKDRCSDLFTLSNLFHKVLPILSKLDLGSEGTYYLAASTMKSKTFHFMRRQEEDRYIHIIAFIAHQYYRLQDNLIDTLLSSINGFENSIKRQYKDLCYESRMQSISSEQNLKLLLKSIKEVTEGSLEADEKIIEITRLLGENSYDEDVNKDDLLYEDLLEKQSIRLQNRITPIVKVIDFQSDKITPLLKAISFFQKKDGIISKNAPLDFLKEMEKKSVLREGFRTSLYKIYLFLHIAQGIKSG